MPDGVVERVLLVVVKEIRTDRIKHPFCDNPPERGVRHVQPHRVDDQQRYPAHGEVQREGQFGEPAERDTLTDHARQHACPEKDEQGPTDPAADNRQAYERVRTRYHDVDRNVVEDAQTGFVGRRCDGMVEGRGEEHQEHAEQEQSSSCNL